MPAPPTRAIRSEMLRGQIELPTFESKVLAGNVLGDPTLREVLVYLPPSYSSERERRYPLMMILPSYASGHRTLMNYRAWQPDVFERYERLLAAAEVPEAILVVPDTMTRWGGSQFINSAATGRYQDYLVQEVLPFVDRRYRTVPGRERRAVVGRSSGGYGALRLAIDRPEVFSVYGSHAGDCLFEASIRPSFTAAAITIACAGGITRFLERFESRGPRGGGDFELIMTIATAACYSPDLEAPFPHIQLPFDLKTALPIDAVWSRWLAHDPVVLLEDNPRAMTEAAYIFLDAGDRDEHGLQFGAQRLASMLEQRGAAVTHERFEGGHRNTGYRYDRSLPLLFGALEA